jgi:GAF domain-containing protein
VEPREWSSTLLSGRGTWKRIALGILLTLVASVPAVIVVRSIRTPFQGVSFVLVIVAATLVGGRVAGAVAVAVAVLALDWYVVPPPGLNFSLTTQFWSVVGFAAVMLVIAQLVSWLERGAERERTERERAALLVRIGDAMSSAIGQERALREVARILVPSFADWAVVHLRLADGSIARVAAVHAAGEEVERALLASPDPDPAGELGVAAVIRSGRAERYVSPTIDEVRRMTADEQQLDVVMRAGLGSFVVAPLIARERTVGALTVVRSPKRRPFSEGDVGFVEEIGERSALVVDNLRLFELERRSAGLTTVLQELTAALSAAVTPADVGRTVVDQGARALAASGAVFGVRGEEGRVEMREAFGHDDRAVDVLRVFSIDDPLPMSQAMRTGRVVVVRSIEERDRRFPALRGVPPPDDHALVCLPFVVRGSAIGGLALTFSEPRSFEPWELSFMESISAQAGQALDRAMLFASERAANERLETSADRLERLLMVAYRLSRARDRGEAGRAIVEVGARSADASTASLLLVDAATQELIVEHTLGDWADVLDDARRVPLSAPFETSEAARTGHPVWIESPEDWNVFPADESVASGGIPVATAALPLVVGGRTLAVLALGYEGTHPFDEDERDFLLTLAGLCAQNLQSTLVLEQRESARAEAERAREQIAFLAEATRLLSSSLDFEATISELADLCVPRIADWLSVVVLDGPQLRQLALTHTDPGKQEMAEQLRTRLPFDPDAPTGLARVLRTGESELLERIDDEMLKVAAPDAETLEALRDLGLTSAVTVPLAAQNRVLGAMTLAYAESGRHYRHGDLTFIESLARRAAVAMDNARLFRDREHMARALQRSLLPRHLPTIPGIELAVRYIPFGQGHDVGGDFYDVFAGLEDGWGLLIGDVCGKGPEAAAIVGIARHTVRGLATASSRPSAILEALNRAILDESPGDRFCTACYVRLRPDGAGFRATVALGGHLPPLLLSRDGSVRQIGEPGSLLGILEHPELNDVVVDLLPGDLLLLYTDGLEEPGRSPAGSATVESILARSAGRPVDDVVDELLARFRGEGGAPPRDDVAILAVRVAEETRPLAEAVTRRSTGRSDASRRRTTLGQAATDPA